MKKVKVFLIYTILLSLLNINFAFAENGKGIFDQTKTYPVCLRSVGEILKAYGSQMGVYLTAKEWCELKSMGYEWYDGSMHEIAYSTYAKVISLKKGVMRIQYNDRYSIFTTSDITVENYIVPKNIVGKTFVVNLMYNNDIDKGDYFIDGNDAYVTHSSKFIGLDLKIPNAYCVKTYGKGYKYLLLTHSCKK